MNIQDIKPGLIFVRFNHKIDQLLILSHNLSQRHIVFFYLNKQTYCHYTYDLNAMIHYFKNAILIT